MPESPNVKPRLCFGPDCGRKVLAGGLCQTHYKQLRERGVLRPIRKVRPRQLGARKVSGLSLSPSCAGEVLREASKRGLSTSATIVDALEAWARTQPGKRV